MVKAPFTIYVMDEYKEDKIQDLIKKRILEVISSGERDELAEWLKDSKENRIIYQKISSEMSFSSELDILENINDEEAWEQLKSQVKIKSRHFRFIRYLKYTAILTIFFISGFLLFILTDNNDSIYKPMINSITPGKTSAYIISSSGNEFFLENENTNPLLLEGNIFVENDENGILQVDTNSIQDIDIKHKLVTPRGGEYKITLSDNSTIVVNSCSELEYPLFFNKESRKVYLSGEGYFSVTKDDDRPFIVVTPDFEVKVYGTEFNINTHPEQGETVLVSGSVSIIHSDRETFITPNQIARFNTTTGTIEVSPCNLKEHTSWKDGFFYFVETELEEIMNTFSLWYDVNFVFASEEIGKIQFTGYFKRYDNLEDILSFMQEISDMKYKVKDGIIIFE